MDKNLTESEEKSLLLGAIDIFRKKPDFECVCVCCGGGGVGGGVGWEACVCAGMGVCIEMKLHDLLNTNCLSFPYGIL